MVQLNKLRNVRLEFVCRTLFMQLQLLHELVWRKVIVPRDNNIR